MKFTFLNKKISGILTVLPSKEIYFEDEMHNYNFSESKSLKLKQAMGFNKKRVAPVGVTSSDLCIYGLQYLIDNKFINKSEIDAIVFISQSPDYIMPPTSNVIQGAMGLKKDVFCLDINQGCAGFIIGLMQSFMLLDQPSIKKVILLNADVLSPKVSKSDRNSNPLIGDAASITILERSISENSEPIHFDIKMDGSGAFALNIPAGGARLPYSEETGILHEDESGNFRSKNHILMKGDEVFNFVQTEVPIMVENVLKDAGLNKEEIDYYFFHQPNKFMLNKLADKLGLPREKMPSNVVENFGNSSGASIPTTICYNLGEKSLNGKFKVCLSGFGVGLTWGAAILELENLNFCQTLDY